MICVLPLNEAKAWFCQLPDVRQIATLSPEYLLADAMREPHFESFFLGYREGQSFWLHSVLRGRVEEVDCWDFQSPYGYGGPVTNSDDPEFCQRAWNAYTGWCTDNRVLVEFIRLHPLATAWQPYGGSVVADRETVVIVLDKPDIRAGYEPRCRTSVRKAERSGLSVSEKPAEEIHSRFPSFYREGMAKIGVDDFYLFGNAYFHAMAELPQAHLLVCESEGEWLAAGIFLKGGETLEYHLSATTPKGRSLSATNLLLDHAAEWARDQNLKAFYLGGGTDGSENNPLYEFKAGFSASRLPFCYAFTIHCPDIYRGLQDTFRQAGKLNSFVLFYR